MARKKKITKTAVTLEQLCLSLNVEDEITQDDWDELVTKSEELQMEVNSLQDTIDNHDTRYEELESEMEVLKDTLNDEIFDLECRVRDLEEQLENRSDATVLKLIRTN